MYPDPAHREEVWGGVARSRVHHVRLLPQILHGRTGLLLAAKTQVLNFLGSSIIRGSTASNKEYLKNFPL